MPPYVLTVITKGGSVEDMTHSSVIEMLGGPRKTAEGLGLNERRVRGWRDRNSIPSKYWPELIRLAK
jgi:hypothetical protein